MKTVKILLFFLGIHSIYSAYCQSKLLESFDLDGASQTYPYGNMICNSIPSDQNCCSYLNQLKIYQNWAVHKERRRIMKLYNEFHKSFEQIFKTFKTIEEQALTIIGFTSDNQSGSNCFKIANTIQQFKATSMEELVMGKLSKSFNFLYNSRKGFYCSLCDAEAHQYYDRINQQITLSEGFCRKMVEETMNHYIFIFFYFMKISRLYATQLVKCNLKGVYYPNRYIPHHIKFFRKKDPFMALNTCKSNLTNQTALKNCEGYCQMFNPTVFNEYLEGDLNKFYAYAMSIANMTDKLQEDYDQENKFKSPLEQKKRLLSSKKKGAKKVKKFSLEKKRVLSADKLEHPDFDAEGKMNEDVNEISQFNKEFKTALIRPVNYIFKEDTTTQHQVDYDQSLFSMGIDKIYNLPKYKVVVRTEGLNFYTYSQGAVINKNNAIKVF